MFPSTIVPSDQTEYKAWLKNWGVALATNMGQDNHKRFTRLYSNRQVYKGIMDPKEFQYLTETYGIRTPARFVGYPFAYKLVEELVGETSADSLEFSVESVDSDIISAKLEAKVMAAVNVLTKPMRKIMGNISIEEMFDEGMGAELPDSITAFDELNFHDHVEIGMMYIMRHLQQKYNWDAIFTEGMREMAINYEGIYRVYVKNGDPFIENVNPSRISFGRSEALRSLQHAPWVRDEQMVPLHEVVDQYRHLVTPEVLATWQKYGTDANDQKSNAWKSYGEYNPNDGQIYLRVVRYEWMATNFLYVKESPNKWDPTKKFLKIVSDPKEATSKKAFNESYEGVYIAGEHINAGPRANQTRNNEDYAQATLSYFGAVRDSISVIDSTKNIVAMICIVMFHMEAMLNRAGGKAVVYDIAQKPGKIPLKDVFYHAKESGLIIINSAEESAQLGRGFNQFQQVDFTLSSSIEQLFRFKAMLEETASSITGINPNRTGEGHHDETNKNNQQKIRQSTYITQSLFDDHFRTVEDVMNEAIGLVKLAWNDNSERTLTVFGERGRETIKLLKKSLGHNYGLFIKNSHKERIKKGEMMAMGQAALSSGKIDFPDLIKMANKSTSKEVERMFVKSMAIMQKNSAQASQAQSQFESEKLALKREEIHSRITAARIEAGAYIETKHLEINAQYGMQDAALQTSLAKATMDSRAALDQIAAAADAKTKQEAGGQQQQMQGPQEPQAPSAQQPQITKETSPTV